MKTILMLMSLLASAVACAAQNSIAVQSAIAPHYPPLAVTARIAGAVSVRVQIGHDGIVSHAEANEGPLPLRQSSEEAAKKWKFSPSDEDQTITLRFTYILLSETRNAEEQDVAFKPPYEVVIEKHPAKPIVDYGTIGVR